MLVGPHNIGCCCLYSSEEQEQSQGKGNAEVEVDKVVELLNQLFSVIMQNENNLLYAAGRNRTIKEQIFIVLLANLNAKKNTMQASRQRKEMLQPIYVM